MSLWTWENSLNSRIGPWSSIDLQRKLMYLLRYPQANWDAFPLADSSWNPWNCKNERIFLQRSPLTASEGYLEIIPQKKTHKFSPCNKKLDSFWEFPQRNCWRNIMLFSRVQIHHAVGSISYSSSSSGFMSALQMLIESKDFLK